MKIKKKDFDKTIDDTYWDGVQAGIRFALYNPTEAEKYKDDVSALKLLVKNMMPKIREVVNALSSYFRMEDE